MIYKIAETLPGGKGLLGIYPDWDGSGVEEAAILRTAGDRYCSLLFTRNYFSQFFQRIAAQMKHYGNLVDIVCGWEVEKIRMYYSAINPAVEVFPLSAMHFNNFNLIREAGDYARSQPRPASDVFFAISDRPDGLKNKTLLVELLSTTRQPLRVTGFGRLDDADLGRLAANPILQFDWRGKAQVSDPAQRLAFLKALAVSRCLLVTSNFEGYARLIGEALCLGVPVLLYAGICCENWVHLDRNNCLLFSMDTFESSLALMLSRAWSFTSPVFGDGNLLLREYFTGYLAQRGLAAPVTWYPLNYGARNDRVITKGDL